MRDEKYRGAGSGRIYKNLAEFTKNASEGVLLLQEWKKFCIFAIKMPRRMIRGASFKPQAIIEALPRETLRSKEHKSEL